MADLNNLSPREQAHEKAQRIIMVTTASAEEADGDRNPMWCSKAFFGTFGDNFVMSTDLEGGQTEQSIPEMIEVAEEIISKLKGSEALSLFDDNDLSTYRKVLGKLSKSPNTSFRGDHTSKSFSNYLKARADQVKALEVEDFCIWCGGWSGTNGGHAIMYIVERTSETEVSFIVCNTGQGVGYHPGVGSDKIKRHTCMRLNNIPLEKITDTVWLYFLFRIRSFGHKESTRNSTCFVNACQKVRLFQLV